MSAASPITNAKLATGASELSAAARLADLVEFKLRVVESDPPDPYADRQIVYAPEVEITLRRRCCSIVVRAPLGASIWGQRFACAHQAGA